MKKVYTEDYFTRKLKARLSRLITFVERSRRKIITVFLLLFLFLFLISCLLVLSDSRIPPATAESVREVAGAGGSASNPPGLYARSAILTDAESGRVLFEKNAHVKLPIASTTKIMTALVIRSQLDLAEKVVVSPEAAAVGEQEIWLTPGETLSVEQLLYALLVQSANDAAFALAQYSAGSAQAFANLMNKKAAQIGAKDSHFNNPHGLDEPGHYSTAYDLALMGRELLKDPALAKMVACRKYDIPWPGHPSPRTSLSHNEILGKYPGANGIKTGYTIAAGQCLVGSATREGKNLIAVVLNSEHRASDVSSLLDFGFNNTTRVLLLKKGQVLGRTRVSSYPKRYVDAIPQDEVAAISVKGAGDVFRVKTSVERQSKSSVKRGTPLGQVECWLRKNPSPVKKEKVVAAGSVNKPDLFTAIIVFIWYALCWMGRIVRAPFRIF